MKFAQARQRALAFQKYPRSATGYFHIVSKYLPHKQRANDETCMVLRQALKPTESANG